MNLLWQQKLCNLQQLKIAVFTYRSPHFCFPWKRPCDYHEYVEWMERQFNACQTPRSMYPLICNSFPVIRTASAQNRRFHVPQPTFLFTLETPLRLSRNVAQMERQFNARQTPRSMHPSIFNSFPVIRTANAKKIAVFTYRSPHFRFSWRRPCDYHAICCMDGKTIQCLPNPSQHVPIYLQ